MFFNTREIKQLEKALEEVKFELDVATRMKQTWFEHWKSTLESKWEIQKQLRAAETELYLARLRIDELEREAQSFN